MAGNRTTTGPAPTETTAATGPRSTRATHRYGPSTFGTIVRLALLLCCHVAFAAAAQVTLEMVVVVDGARVEVAPAGAWAAEAGLVERQGDRFQLADDATRLEIAFAGGSANIAAADIGVWDFAHVLAVVVRRQPDGHYRFDTTVRHRDEGWEHYADVWRVVGAGASNGVANGERILLHPHDDEQPFTRSQSAVAASGVVLVEASDNVHGRGGTVIGIDLDALAGDVVTVEIHLEPVP